MTNGVEKPEGLSLRLSRVPQGERTFSLASSSLYIESNEDKKFPLEMVGRPCCDQAGDWKRVSGGLMWG